MPHGIEMLVGVGFYGRGGHSFRSIDTDGPTLAQECAPGGEDSERAKALRERGNIEGYMVQATAGETKFETKRTYHIR